MTQIKINTVFGPSTQLYLTICPLSNISLAPPLVPAHAPIRAACTGAAAHPRTDRPIFLPERRPLARRRRELSPVAVGTDATDPVGYTGARAGSWMDRMYLGRKVLHPDEYVRVEPEGSNY